MTYTEAVELAMQGEERGFGYLYQNSYKSKLYLALQYMKNEEDAKDVLQDAYIKAFSRLGSLQDPEKFQAWLGQIVANTAKNALVKKNPVLFSDIASEDDGEPFEFRIEDEDTSRQPELAYTKEETRQLVRELMDSLSEEQRICVLMFHIEGASIKEIAEALDCSENTVKSRLNYGRKNIKRKAEDLQKKGYKLYGLAPLPLLLLLFRKDAYAEYRITLIDKSADSHSIIAKVYDEYGTQLGSGEGYADGLAVTFSPENLETNTTYYVCLSLWQEVETSFMMVVRDGNEMESGIGASDSTDSNFDTDNIIIATNMDDAPSVPSESKIESSMENGNHYYAFTPSTTGEYKFTVVDITADSHSAIAKVYDEYGTELGSGEAYSDGTAVTFTAGELTAGTTYYVRVYLWQEVYTGYTITIHEPEAPEEEDTAEIISEDDNTAVIIEDESDETGSGDENTAVIIEE